MYKPTNPKIDIYANGVYQFSTNWYKNTTDALRGAFKRRDDA